MLGNIRKLHEKNTRKLDSYNSQKNLKHILLSRYIFSDTFNIKCYRDRNTHTIITPKALKIKLISNLIKTTMATPD